MRQVSSQAYYVAGELSFLVLGYLNQHNLPAKGLRHTLATYPKGSRMPIAVWWQLLDRLQKIQRDPLLGTHIGQQIQYFHPGVLGYLVAHTSTVKEAVQCFQRYQVLLHNYGPVSLEHQGHEVVVTWDYLGKRSTPLSDEIFLSALIAFIHHVTGETQITPTRVSFQHSLSQHSVDSTAPVSYPIAFDQPHLAIAFHQDILDLPINSSDPFLRDILDKQARALCSELDQTDATLAAIEQAIVEALSTGSPNAPHIADSLHISRRTLYRRLAARGYNYHQFLQQTRKRLAIMYLEDTQLTLVEIGFLLGYSEHSAFSRAFKSWTGESPQHYRAR